MGDFLNPLYRAKFASPVTPPFFPPTDAPSAGGPAPAPPPDPSVLSTSATSSGPGGAFQPTPDQLPKTPEPLHQHADELVALQQKGAEIQQNYHPSIWRKLAGVAMAGLGGYAAATGGARGEPSPEEMKLAEGAGHGLIYGPRDRALAALGPQEAAAKTGMATEEKQNQLNEEIYKGQITMADAAARLQEAASRDRATDTYRQSALESTNRRFDEAEKQRADEAKARLEQGAREDQANRDLRLELANLANQRKEGDKYYSWTDATGKRQWGTGDQVPSGVQRFPIKDMGAQVDEFNVNNLVQESFNRVSQMVHDHPEIWDNNSARNILLAGTDGLKLQLGALINGTGGSISVPPAFGDAIATGLRRGMLDQKTADALNQYMAHYKNMIDKAVIVQMEMQGGKIGRGNQRIIDSIMQQIPDGRTANSAEANASIRDFQAQQDRLRGMFPESYGGISKTPVWQPQAAPQQGQGAGGAGGTGTQIPAPPGPPAPGMTWEYSPSRKQFRQVPVNAATR